jgi:hypothetical protein
MNDLGNRPNKLVWPSYTMRVLLLALVTRLAFASPVLNATLFTKGFNSEFWVDGTAADPLPQIGLPYGIWQAAKYNKDADVLRKPERIL